MGELVIERPMTIAQRQAILQAYARGVITESQAIEQLKLQDSQSFYSLLERLCVQEWEALRKAPMPSVASEEYHDGSISDGFANYWLSRNRDLES